MLKYAGVLLTKEHIFKLASSILQENLDDIHDVNTFLRAYMTVWRVLTRNHPKYFIHPMSMPRRSPKSEHSRFLLVCRVCRDPYETRMNYAKMPATEMDANILDWLKENGMESQEILDQWTTIPNPEASSTTALLQLLFLVLEPVDCGLQGTMASSSAAPGA
ncbi:uncharacterized protein FOMMEDRAFT_151489 [Fomitiporia mediterranea MF3/22]|uniref:uncharacterized protein n=1 Tax=Fomitiporia mediterranea (strain MF3/22) TaxID=694068 RepID=UPI000440916C|nr:uncharacterized protein FOMMEDRAFT_151489 [Fomitiporia mediterranea MF3/22]EJD08603.1 hypothetical protein FOMMEDRAFT_151489 [Fomitiporia mediterranea MF3/22]